MKTSLLTSCLFTAVLAAASTARATETENHGLRVLPATGKVAIDGSTDGWDLSAGIFACGDTEHLRDKYSVWIHAMYDADNVYIMARWKDENPLSNPEKKGGYAWNGDCLQVRFILFPDSGDRTATWWSCWRDATGISVVERACPGIENGFKDNVMETIHDAAEQGVRQAFKVDPDGKGYVQAIAIPWKLLSKSGAAPKPGSRFRITVEPNFTAGKYTRVTIKDIFDDKIASPERVFTFDAFNQWGWATLLEKGKVEPQPVRLADGRTFKVSMQQGLPVVDWTGLIQKFEWPGLLPVNFEMPFDGYVSLNILDSQGKVARHLLNWDKRSAGKQTVQWDGLSDCVYRTPGEPLAPGQYTYAAIAHPGAKITFRGFACYGGRAPWQSSPADQWLGDHGVPSAVVAEGNMVYLACNAAEGGRHLLGVDLQGHVIWGLQNTTGGLDPYHIAVDGETVYILHPPASTRGRDAVVLSRADAATGVYTWWKDRKTMILKAGDIWGANEPAMGFAGIAARGGKIYLSASDPAITSDDVLDWKLIVGALKNKKDDPRAVAIMSQINPNYAPNFEPFLAGKMTLEEAFNPGWAYSFIGFFFGALPGAVDGNALMPADAGLLEVARRHANRKALVDFFAGGLRAEPQDRLLVLDGATGKVLRSFELPQAGALAAVNDNLLYAICGGKDIVAVDPGTGHTTTVISNLSNARDLTVTPDGGILVSVGEPDMQVFYYKPFKPQGKDVFSLAGSYGKKGGRPLIGRWQPDAMCMPSGVAVDAEGKLWVMESFRRPKRVSVWNMKDGSLIKDFLGPTHYGASGSAINPRDPNLMICAGCEWRLDPNTGRSACLGTFDTTYHDFATFREGSNGRLYLYTHSDDAVKVWERLGDANFALRCRLSTGRTWTDANGWSELWVDRGNGHGGVQRQLGMLLCTGTGHWSLNLGPDLTLYAFDRNDHTLKSLPAAGFTGTGAPNYDLAALKPMPPAMSNGYWENQGCAVPSADNKRILLNLAVKDHPAGLLWECFDLSTGALLWTYPDPYFEVNGSHSAPAPDPGLFRGAFGPVGAVNIPGAGPTWIINGNLGEWYALTADGFFLSRVFNGNIFEWHWPADASPGADMTDLPCGCGGEDFGGSVTQADNGGVYLEAGKMSAWNCLLTGLDKTVKAPGGGTLTLTADAARQAAVLREQALQRLARNRRAIIKRATVAITGKLYDDFTGIAPIEYRKSEDFAVRTWLAHDDSTLYLAWDVRDPTPWVNGAKDIAQIYATGDTVDLQLATDPKADVNREKAAAGDVRVAIGNFGGKPVAVLYKFISTDKKPREFSSGVVKAWQVDYVAEMPEAKIDVKVQKDRYMVEAAIPLSALGVRMEPGLRLRGDVGVTHVDPSGTRTRLRTYWSNQETGLVDDVVFELMPAPRNWGEFTLD